LFLQNLCYYYFRDYKLSGSYRKILERPLDLSLYVNPKVFSLHSMKLIPMLYSEFIKHDPGQYPLICSDADVLQGKLPVSNPGKIF
jgi:hypothetical protein